MIVLSPSLSKSGETESDTTLLSSFEVGIVEAFTLSKDSSSQLLPSFHLGRISLFFSKILAQYAR